MVKKMIIIILSVIIISSGFGNYIEKSKANSTNRDTIEALYDGTLRIYDSGPNENVYYDMWYATNGVVLDTLNWCDFGQCRDQDDPPGTRWYYIGRYCIFFDTSSIPDNAIIEHVELHIKTIGSITCGCSLPFYAQRDPNGVYPHNPLQTGDYYKSHYSNDVYLGNAKDYSAGWKTINADGIINWINKAGVTKFVIRYGEEISGTPPPNHGIHGPVQLYSTKSDYIPYLEIEYNDPPNKPSKPQGQTSGNANTDYTYTTSTTDPEGDQIYYKFDWDDGTYSDWIGPYDSGQTGSATHNWECGGSYSIKAKAKDVNDLESPWSDALTVTISNNQPNPPSTPTGTTSGYHGVSYTYSTSATDPDNHQVKIYFDWGDGTGTWTDYVNSGQSVSKSHIWNAPGNYNVKAKAKDTCGLEGGWSGNLPVYMQNQAPNTPNTPNPLDGATNVGTNAILSWEGGDPNGDTVYYDVYFGTTNPPPKIINDQTSTTYDPPGELEVLTTYYWQIIAEDEHGDQAPGPIWSFTTREYHAPVLSLYDGWQTGHIPDSGNQQTDFTFCIHYYDADHDSPVEKKLLFSNGKEFTMELFNGLDYDGDYKVVLKGSQIGGGTHTYWFWYKDLHDGVRFPAPGEEWAVTINHAPNAPILSGPSNGVPGTEYIFSAVTDDPEGDDIKYKFDWGDGTDTGWIPTDTWKASGNSIDAKHSWSKGTYTIQAKAIDREGDESPWSNEITLKVQKGRYLNYDYLQNFIEKFIQKFPLLEIFLKLINV